MSQPSSSTVNPTQAAVNEILNTDNGRNTIEWQTCQCIWDSSQLISSDASQNEVRQHLSHHPLPSDTCGQVSVFGVKGHMLDPTGSSNHFSLRHCFDFADAPVYYVQISLGTGVETGGLSKSIRFAPPADSIADPQILFEENVRHLTDVFRLRGVVGTARWLFGNEFETVRVNGIRNGH